MRQLKDPIREKVNVPVGVRVGPLFEGGAYAMAATSPKEQSRAKPAAE